MLPPDAFEATARKALAQFRCEARTVKGGNPTRIMQNMIAGAFLILALSGLAGCVSTGSPGRNIDDSANIEDSERAAVKPPPQPSGESVPEVKTKPLTRELGLPTVIVAANYPKKALDQGIEGHVVLEYTVTKTGDLQDIVVIGSSPPGYFEQAAIQAVTGFRYQPKIVNGEPVDVPRAQYKMLFKLEYLRPRG